MKTSKKKLRSGIIVLLIAPVIACCQEVISAYWDFNESSGSMLYDLVGTNSGTLYDGGSVYDGGTGGSGPDFVSGRPGAGSALEFNVNSATLDDSVQLNNSDNFDIGRNDFTITGWFKAAPLDPASGQHASLFSDAVYDVSGVNLILYRGNGGGNAGKLVFGIKSFGVLENISVKSNSRLDDNNWHWFAAVTENQEATLYVDGIKQNSQTYGTTTTAEPARTPIFGSPGFIGMLDDFSFFRFALGGTQTNNLLIGGALYRAWKQTPLNAKKKLVSYWNCNESTGTTLYDSAGINDGTLYDGSSVYDGGSSGTGPCFITGRTNAGNALSLNMNSAAIDDSVLLSNPMAFNFEHAGDFTISGWFQADPLSTNSGQHATLFSDAVYDESGVNFILYRGNGGGNAGKLVFGVKSPGATNNCSLKSANRLDDSEWHWFAGVVRSQTMYLYVDGEFVDLFPYGLSTTAAPAEIPGLGIPGLIGSLDDFSIFNYAVLGNRPGGQLYNLWTDGPLAVEHVDPVEPGLILSPNTTAQGTRYYDMWDATMPTTETGAGYPILSNAVHSLVHYATTNSGGYNHKPFIIRHNGCFYTSWANHRYGEDGPGQRCLLSISSNATEWSVFKNFFAAPDEVGGFDESGLFFSPKPWRVCDSKLYGMVTLYESVGFENVDGTSFSETHDAIHCYRVINKVVDIAREVKDETGQLGTMFALQDISEGISLPFTVLPPNHPTIRDARELLLIPDMNELKSQTGLPVPIDFARLCEASFFEGQNGDWVCLTRDNSFSHRMYASFSDDQGVSWSPARPTNIPDSPSQTISVTLSNGVILLIGNQCATEFDNPTDPKHYGRDPLVISISTNGYTFANPYALRTGQQEFRIENVSGRGGGAQAPNAQIFSNKLYVVYSMGKEDIWSAVVNLSDIGQ